MKQLNVEYFNCGCKILLLSTVFFLYLSKHVLWELEDNTKKKQFFQTHQSKSGKRIRCYHKDSAKTKKESTNNHQLESALCLRLVFGWFFLFIFLVGLPESSPSLPQLTWRRVGVTGKTFLPRIVSHRSWAMVSAAAVENNFSKNQSTICLHWLKCSNRPVFPFFSSSAFVVVVVVFSPVDLKGAYLHLPFALESDSGVTLLLLLLLLGESEPSPNALENGHRSDGAAVEAAFCLPLWRAFFLLLFGLVNFYLQKRCAQTHHRPGCAN